MLVGDLEFIVQAVNGSRQSVASGSVVLYALAAKKRGAAKEIFPVSIPAENGHTNGNGSTLNTISARL